MHVLNYRGVNYTNHYPIIKKKVKCKYREPRYYLRRYKISQRSTFHLVWTEHEFRKCIVFRFRDLTVANKIALGVSQPIRSLRITGCVLLGERVLLGSGWWFEKLIRLKRR